MSSFRKFLTAGIGLGAAASIGRGLFLGYPEKAYGAGVLNRKEQAIVAACADSFFPPGGPIALCGTDAGLVRYFDQYVSRLPGLQITLVRLLLWFIEHTPWVFGPQRTRFSSLALAQRLAVLDEMQTSRIYFRRISFLSMRTMLTMGYLAHPEVAKAMRMRANVDPFGLGDNAP